MDVVGLSILSGAHLALCPRIVRLLREQGMEDVTVLVVGVIPDEDLPKLKADGVHAAFGPSTPTATGGAFIHLKMANT